MRALARVSACNKRSAFFGDRSVASLGVTFKIADTGLFADVEGIYGKGKNEIIIRDTNWSGNATR